MKKVYLFIIFLISILFGELFSQQVVQPSVKIKDHNGTYDLINIDCDYKYYPTKSVQLTAEYPIIGYPNDYTVSKVDYAPVASFSAGNLIHIEQGIGKYDDTFGDAVELPFTFCFYGKEYNYVIISDNGVVSFDTSQANKENPYTIAGSIPNTGLPKAAIFGAYHDMQLVDNSNQSINMVRVLIFFNRKKHL